MDFPLYYSFYFFYQVHFIYEVVIIRFSTSYTWKFFPDHKMSKCLLLNDLENVCVGGVSNHNQL